MPPIPPPLVPEVFQITTRGNLGGQPCDHVINWFLPGSTINPAIAAQDFALADAQAWMPIMAPGLPPFYTYEGSKVVYLGDTSTAPATAGSTVAGTSPGPWVTRQTCVTWRHHVAVRGRGKQGRTNVPSPEIGDIDASTGQLTPGAITRHNLAWSNYQLAIENYMTGAGHGVPVLIVLDRKTGGYNVPTNTTVDPFPNTHRRWQKRLARH